MNTKWLKEVQELDDKTATLNQELDALAELEEGSTDYLIKLLEIQLRHRELSIEADRLSKCQY